MSEDPNPPVEEIYVSTDIETDGPIPGDYSMLSIGSAAFRADKTLVDTFSINFELLPGAGQHPKTMRFWEDFPEAWEKSRENPRPPEEAMPEYVAWVKSLPGKPVFVGYPAGFDFTFVLWYLVKFAGESPFHFAALDIKTYAMAVLRRKYRHTTKTSLPRHWFDDLPHTHVALDDALEQGALFCNMLAEHNKAPRTPVDP